MFFPNRSEASSALSVNEGSAGSFMVVFVSLCVLGAVYFATDLRLLSYLTALSLSYLTALSLVPFISHPVCPVYS